LDLVVVDFKLVSFFISCVALAFSPGPDNMFLFSLSLTEKKKNSFLFLFGLITGCIVHTLALMFGLNLIVAKFPVVLDFFKFTGFVYLVFLSIKLLYTKIDFKDDFKKNQKINFYMTGFLMNILNPKVFVFFSVFFPNFIFSSDISFSLQILILGLIFIISTFLVFSIIIFTSNYISIYLKSNSFFNSIKSYLSSIVLFVIALLILFA
jgi:threonine/homoserine/homoserine lactone efflux protein